MTAALWSGMMTATRYTIACPHCHSLGAEVGSDTLGRTLVACRCSAAPFLMPLVVGGQGAPWPIDLSNCPPDPAPAGGRAIDDDPDARRCETGDSCGRRVGPRSRYCGVCAPIVAATPRKCSVSGCQNTMSYKAERCESCARAYRLKRNRQIMVEHRQRKAERLEPARVPGRL